MWRIVITIVVISFFGIPLNCLAECKSINESHFFVTKAQKGKEVDKNPIYVPEGGDYIFEKALSCQSKSVHVSFWGAHYAQDPGAGFVRIEILDNMDKKIGEKTFYVSNLMTGWKDIYVNSEPQKKKYDGDIDLQSDDARRLRIFASAGNWATIISELSITFDKK